uniref:Hydroxyacyl-thioester dehydratase type 2, mitochondrial n=1 Tax=Culex pipiens TaxID=7175 RepID=A0A8D8FPU9_CULPI
MKLFTKLLSATKISTGQVITLSRTFRQEDLVRFAEFTGDPNPIHRSAESFVNGALLNATTAGIIGTHFPGYVVTWQEFRFPNRCRCDEEVRFDVRVEELRKIVRLSYECSQGGRTVFAGAAKLFGVTVKT